MHNFKRVAILDSDRGQGRSRHDLQIALDRDPRRIKPYLGNESSNGRSCGHAPLLAINSDYESGGVSHIV